MEWRSARLPVPYCTLLVIETVELGQRLVVARLQRLFYVIQQHVRACPATLLVCLRLLQRLYRDFRIVARSRQVIRGKLKVDRDSNQFTPQRSALPLLENLRVLPILHPPIARDHEEHSSNRQYVLLRRFLSGSPLPHP